MKTLAVLVGVFFVLLGIFGVARPGDIISFGYRLDTPTGLYLVAALRIGIGLVLLAAASASRTPNALRVVGGVILLAGIATAFMRVGYARAALDWFTAQGPSFIRMPFLVVIAVGVFLISSLVTRHHDAHT